MPVRSLVTVPDPVFETVRRNDPGGGAGAVKLATHASALAGIVKDEAHGLGLHALKVDPPVGLAVSVTVAPAT